MTHKKIKRGAIFQRLLPVDGNSFNIKRYESPFFETPWHFHEEYELVYCEKGSGKRFIGNSYACYEEGDMAFIGKNVPHLFKAEDAYYSPEATVKPSSIVIQFREDFLGNAFFHSIEMLEMKQIMFLSLSGLLILGETREKIKKIIFRMLEADKIVRLNAIIEIFCVLSVSNDLQLLSGSINGINASDSIKMSKLLDYALNNYKLDVSIYEAAKTTNLSESAFCRYFKSRTQKTFISFIIEMRLGEAKRLLKETDIAVLAICYKSGFKNLSNFNRLFKKHYQVSPVEYRKKENNYMISG